MNVTVLIPKHPDNRSVSVVWGYCLYFLWELALTGSRETR
jgi:hypothetical protein